MFSFDFKLCCAVWSCPSTVIVARVGLADRSGGGRGLQLAQATRPIGNRKPQFKFAFPGMQGLHTVLFTFSVAQLRSVRYDMLAVHVCLRQPRMRLALSLIGPAQGASAFESKVAPEASAASSNEQVSPPTLDCMGFGQGPVHHTNVSASLLPRLRSIRFPALGLLKR